jgi:hypothetical protein
MQESIQHVQQLLTRFPRRQIHLINSTQAQHSSEITDLRNVDRAKKLHLRNRTDPPTQLACLTPFDRVTFGEIISSQYNYLGSLVTKVREDNELDDTLKKIILC